MEKSMEKESDTKHCYSAIINALNYAVDSSELDIKEIVIILRQKFTDTAIKQTLLNAIKAFFDAKLDELDNELVENKIGARPYQEVRGELVRRKIKFFNQAVWCIEHMLNSPENLS